MDELVVPALHLPDSRLIAQIIRELQLDCLEERISFPHLLAKLTAVTESNGGAIALYDEPSSALSAIAQALPN
ncbi:MAG TPA: hypothetical protein VN132_01490, partial [Bdellovibrio sp.]|nr:hypothetical protein [Bdellovibrio sp.]